MHLQRFSPFVIVVVGLLLGSLGPVPLARGQHSDPGPPSEEASPQSLKAQQLLVRGLTHQQLDEHERALEFFDQALRLASNNAAILAALAASHEALDDLPTALFFAEQARRHGPDNIYHYFLVAELHMRAGELSTAEAAYETLLARFPDDWDALQSLAQVQTMLSKDHEAIATYEKLIAQAEHYADVRRQVLPLYLRVGDVEGAERTLEAITEIDPRDAPAWRSLGDLYVQQNKLEEAIHAFEQALLANLNDTYAATALADVYRALGQNAEAEALLDRSLHLEHASVDDLLARARPLLPRASFEEASRATATEMLERALELDPDNGEALAMLGDLYFETGAYGKAARALEQALQENPRDPGGWYRAAASYLEAGEPTRAAEIADEALLLFPGHLRLLRASAHGLLRSYRTEEALLRFEEALAVAQEDAPDDVALRSELYASMGQLYDRQKRHGAADSAYAQALEIAPNNAVALNNYAFSLANRRERLREAQQLAERAVAQEPRNPIFLDTLGWVFFNLDQLDQAEAMLTQALASDQAGAAVYEHYGDVMARRGDLETARQYWQQALDRAPGNVALQEKLQDDR